MTRLQLLALAVGRCPGVLHGEELAGLRWRRARRGDSTRFVTESTSPALAAVTSSLPNAEERLGQQHMADLVARAIESGRHLVVQAGTGTGKTLAYLVPAISSGSRIVVATATKALQDQLAGKDLPFLDDALDVPFEWAVLKGRSNYVCLQRLREMHADAAGQLELEDMNAAIRGERAPRLGRADALGQARTIEALYRSAGTGESVTL